MILKTWDTPNWGDAINSELVKIISGQEPTIVKAKEILDGTNYLVVGSTLKFADNNTTVWGAGFLTEDEDFGGFNPMIKAVRGPRTRRRLKQLGFDCPKIFGDPVLLFPRFYQPQVEKRYKLGIIPHWKDELVTAIEDMKLPEGVIKIRHDLKNYEFIDMICSCERIASSSLHGIIVADAYGIPNVQLQVEKQDMFKWQDYYYSVGRKVVDPIDCSKGIDVEAVLAEKFYDGGIDIDLDKLMSVCPFQRKVNVSNRKIVISPFSKRMRNSEQNPKNFPFWEDVVSKLQKEGYYVVQVGVVGEKMIGADEVLHNKSLDELETLIKECETWISVDNFFQHLCKLVGKKGVVLWGKSDPKLFGYEDNINLLKNKKYLRQKQFDIWEKESYEEAAFVGPGEVVEAVKSITLKAI